MSGPDDSTGEAFAVSTRDEQPSSRNDRNALGAAVLAVLLVVVALLGLLRIAHSPQVSLFDEFAHFDTLEKNSRFVLVGQGERISQTTMREVACHGMDITWEFDSCDAATFDSDQFPGQGWNTAYTASPLYYALTGWGGRFIQFSVPPIDSLLTASRLASVSWVLLAVSFMWLLLGEFSIPYSIRFFVIILIATAPTVLHLSSIVNPDITGMVGGAAIAWLTVRWERGASPAWLLVLVAALTVLGKPLNAVVVGAMVLYLVVRYFQQSSTPDSGDWRFRLRGILALIAGFLIGAIPWLIVQSALATVPDLDVPMIRDYAGATITLADVTSQFTAVVSPLRAAYMPALVAGPLTALVAVGSDIFMLGSNIGVAMLSLNRRASALATAALISAFLLGPTVVIFMYVTHHGFLLPASPRYGLPLIPLFAVGIGVIAAAKAPGRIALGILSLASLAVITTEMIGIM